MEQAMTFYPYTHGAFKYVGVWQENEEHQLVSYWNRSVAEIGFSGDVVVIQGTAEKPVTFCVDGGEMLRGIPEGETVLTVGPGEHVLRIITKGESRLRLAGIAVKAGEYVFRTPDKPYLQFIGDSITDACPGYSYSTGENLDVDYSVRAYSGMSLRDGWGWYPVPEGMVRPGMESMYYQLKGPLDTNRVPYRITYCRQPDAFVIFLGTNDYLDSESDQNAGHVEIFAETYDRFVTGLASRYPKARFFLLQGLSDKYCRREGILKAWQRMAAHLPQVTLVPSDQWQPEISADGTHPSPKGYMELAEKLTAYLIREMKWQTR